MSCNNVNYCKSTLVATTYGVTLANNQTATFLTSVQKTGNAITIASNNQTFNLRRAGLYRVTLSATGNSTADATAISLQLNRAGIALTSGVASQTLAETTDIGSMGFSTIVEVKTTCPNQGSSAIGLTITNTGNEAQFAFIILTIEKIA